MVGAILGGLSAVASAISIIQNNQGLQKAQKAANMWGQQLQGIKETNVFTGLKSADISGLQAQQTAAQTTQATQAVQGMGQEGAAQVANIYQAGLQQNAENMQRQAQMDYQTELTKREAEQGVQWRNVAAQRDLAASRLEGAQDDVAQRRKNVQDLLGQTIGGLGMAAGDIAGLSQFDYGTAAYKRQQLANKGYNSEEIDQILSSGMNINKV